MKDDITRFKEVMGIVDEDTVSNEDFEISLEVDMDEVLKDYDKK